MGSFLNRTVTRTDAIDPARAAALHAVLNCEGPVPEIGGQLPRFWHLIYFWDAARPEELGEDGHLKPGGFIPDFGMDQRMWAAGSLDPKKPLIVGSPAERLSTIEKVEEKHGRAGPLKFVTIRHEILQNGVALVERRQLVYRNAQRGPVPRPDGNPPSETRCELEIVFDEVMLFRYSALTFNSHRIHYDADYCRNVAGYPGIVVQGPLLATFLAQAASKAGGDFKRLNYRATAPAFAGETVRIFSADSPDGLCLWACSGTGRLCMKGECLN